ncbi:MAG: hypothetical protein AAF495_14685 [Pseudomonadota bacterium]
MDRTPKALLVGAALALLAGCSTDKATFDPGGIGFHEARYAEVSATRDFRACFEEALQLDSQARSSGDLGRYLASARVLESCEANLGPEANGVAKEERMRAYGLTVQNYLKGGDAVSARRNLDRFRQAFPENDLYYADGASFLTTMEVLLGQEDTKAFGQFAVLNVSGQLKDEMRRMHHWKSQ